jgi:hypothetical protein
MEIFMEKVKLYTKLENNFRVDLIIINKFKELLCIQMEINILDHFLKVKNMVKGVIIIQLEMYIKAFLNIIKNKDLVF